MRFLSLLACVPFAVAAPALAQSINLRFGGPGAVAPDSSYGAVGPAGYWNIISSGSPLTLRDLAGTPTAVSNFVPSDFRPVTFPLTGPTDPIGNDARLLETIFTYDSYDPSEGTTLTISGLANGQYNLIFYGISGQFGFTSFSSGSEQAVLAGDWHGSLAPGIYDTLPFSVTAHSLSFHLIFGIEGGAWSAMQIVQVPGPSGAALSIILLAGLASPATRRRHGPMSALLRTTP